MTDIVERLREYNSIPAVGSKLRIGKAIADAADEIERLRAENQELKLQYLSDQGQWIEETGQLREALSAMTELFKATEASAQWALSELRTALGEKELCLKKA